MGRISRTASYAIASSIQENQQPCITCTTFNILAPIYKRLNQEQDQSCRESDYKACWLARNQRILNWLLYERSSIICLQEFWIGNEELVNLYDKRLGDAGYVNFKLERTNNRGDGLLIAVQKEYFTVVNYKELHFNDCGDRVAQLLHVELAFPFSHQNSDITQEILIVNTHLLFPHDTSLSLVRLHQVYKILQYVESYQKEKQLKPLPIMLCGDWNGSKRGHVYKFLRSQGFVSSYDAAHHYTDADAHKWVSHRNHRGNICAVDFIWLLNPDKYQKLLKTSWSEAVFGMFKQIWNLEESDQRDDMKNMQHDEGRNDSEEEQTIGFSVKNAVLFPQEVEKGRWPEDYSLSDHARLIVMFSPIRIVRL
ncbi:uncharacterized calcium-binding protein At1g02270 isoform X7 [Cajanus cajan]|uniref:uncharacterized calcium-binding protein At1g02270 isoform X7 n=1 Tax=Cajanus cajan TaxID=3821 RepID=UPI00098D789C|nr:uncharacterized calcium-binding protein At1g02270 isoform X7 [Cajanus cajan]